MTKVTLAKPVGGHKVGATITVPDSTAERFIARGIAEKPRTKAAATKAKAEGVGGDSPSPA